jgi:uncharacterized protein YpuA (DUF1002 family)
MDTTSLIVAIAASLLSGLAAAILSATRDHKKEIKRQVQREQDNLKLELKDLQINLFKLEKELDQWKIKYYGTLEELISVKAELEKAIIALTHIEHH